MSLVIVVDSSSDLPAQRAAEAGIYVVPMPVTIDGQTYLEGVEIFPEEFYTRFGSFAELPKTSQPNLHTLIEYYEKVLQNGDEVVAIHLSSGLSSTVATAFLARDMCSAPERVHILDSLGASLGYGLLALNAAEVLKTNLSWPATEAKLLQLRDKMRYVFTLDTLEFLVKGGRVGKTAGFVGNLLDVKPILHITAEGRIEQYGKVRSRKAALRKLVELIEQEIVSPEQQVIGISHSNCLDEVMALAEEIRSRIPVKDILISDIGCVVGSHTGPGTIALFYQR